MTHKKPANNAFDWNENREIILPASQCGLKQRCDAHTEENGPNELTGGPLVKANTHGLSKEERYCDSPAKTCQVVLQGQATDCVLHRFQCCD